MLILMIVICVLIGLAYADYCLVDNSAHFGITFQRVAEAEQRATELALAEIDEIESTAEEGEVLVPPAVVTPSLAAESIDRSAVASPRFRPGSPRRTSGSFPARSAADAGVAAVGN